MEVIDSILRETFRSCFPNRTQTDRDMLQSIAVDMQRHLDEKVLDESKLQEARNILQWSNEILSGI